MLKLHTVSSKMIEAYRRIFANPDTYHRNGLNTFGHVGAWLKVPGRRNWIWAQSHKVPGTNLWVHAERACIDKACKILKVDMLPEGCILISTLEPCNHDIDMDDRVGCNCSTYIGQQGIKLVYFGTRDDKNMENGQWKAHPFKWILSQSGPAKDKCDTLFEWVKTR